MDHKASKKMKSKLVIPALERPSSLVQEVPCSLVYLDLGDKAGNEVRVMLKVGSYNVATLIPGVGLELASDLPDKMPAHFPFPVCTSNQYEIEVFPEYQHDDDN